MSELLPNWVNSTLGELAGTGQYGWTTKASDQGNVKFLRTTDITKGKIDWQRVPFCSEAPSDVNKYSLSVGDILISRAGSVGFSSLLTEVPETAVFASYLIRYMPNMDIVAPCYLAHYLKSQEYWNQIADVSAGVALANVNATKLAALTLPLAPLNEQKRIADKLDAVLARVDACRDRLDRIPAILKRFRQSVLAAATSGKLTEEWRAEHVAALLSSVWQVGTLANLLTGKPRNGYSPRAVEYKTSVKSLTLTATTSGQFKGEHFKYIDEEISPDSHLWLQPGDILIQRANTLESVGISAIFDGPPSTYIYPDLMMKAKANELVKPKFLHYLLLSEPVRRHFRDNATGTAGNMPKINQPTVLSAPVTWPSLDEQAEIVCRVESLFALADRLEARHQAARAQVEKLTPSTLAKAFRGELVPQDPNDEPASKLLERIRANSTSMPTKSGGRKQNNKERVS